jgi:cobalamin synthase
MKKQNQKPDVAAGTFGVIFGAVCFLLAIFVATDLGQKLWGIGCGLMLLGFGSRQLAMARKKKKKELDDAKKNDQSNH